MSAATEKPACGFIIFSFVLGIPLKEKSLFLFLPFLNRIFGVLAWNGRSLRKRLLALALWRETRSKAAKYAAMGKGSVVPRLLLSGGADAVCQGKCPLALLRVLEKHSPLGPRKEHDKLSGKGREGSDCRNAGQTSLGVFPISTELNLGHFFFFHNRSNSLKNLGVVLVLWCAVCSP